MAHSPPTGLAPVEGNVGRRSIIAPTSFTHDTRSWGWLPINGDAPAGENGLHLPLSFIGRPAILRHFTYKTVAKWIDREWLRETGS